MEHSEQTLDYFVHPSSYVDQPCQIGAGTRIWHFSHIMAHTQIGAYCNLGQNVVVSARVQIGNGVKIQNNVSIYEGTIIEDDVFLGPSCVLTNVSNPRSQVLRKHLYEKTLIRRGATIGANATIVCGTEIGRYAFIAAGAVVTRDVPDYALMMGTPARQHGWMSRHGHRLIPDTGGLAVCPESGLSYVLSDGRLHCRDLDEDQPLPQVLAKGEAPYQQFKASDKE
ncbi:MAG: N-acetyltransferase [Candidatus Melainabacteria bacterium HGW-Melainabacteria-1]|nr:MAG: N-acetyltransferase [Candidatus Melainabacteria bacterium HGW-Melainabacteria-1]